MSALLLALALMLDAGGASATRGGPAIPPPARQGVTGKATYYAPGVMETVYRNRLRMAQVQPCPECVGYLAVRSCADLGRRAWVQYTGQWYGPFEIIDCAAPADLPAMVQRGRVVEVAYEWALAWGISGPAEVVLAEEFQP
jgi:hypothetical protein